MKGAVVLDKLEVHTFPEEGGFCIVYNKVNVIKKN